MTSHVRLPEVDGIATADAWFNSLGKPYKGRLPVDDALAVGKRTGWLVATRGRSLAVVVDEAFPFTRPKVYLRDDHDPTPHIEADGRLCLANPDIPSDPAAAVMNALRLAQELLDDIDAGREDGDFAEDFGLYWHHSTKSVFKARLLLPDMDRSAVIHTCATRAAAYGFGSNEAARRWWSHRFNEHLRKTRQGALVALEALPHPDRYPTTGEELWRLVESESQDGITVLEGLLRQNPKSLLVVLAGRSPGGRRHAVGVMLERPIDRAGRPVNRRIIERGHARNRIPPRDLCTRLQVRRLTTEMLDAANSRLPYAERERLAAARIAIIGCGALGSGVARLLAKSGVGHFVLVDPENLGWENIRRHQLGAGFVGQSKATMLAKALAQENPDIGSTKAHDISVEHLLVLDPDALTGVDLIVAATASWSANCRLDILSARYEIPVIYAWMEAHAIAAHAALIMPGHSYRSGFDRVGNPRITASISRKDLPPECGAATSPFGAVELAQAETLASRLALDRLRGKAGDTIWRTWLTDAAALEEAEGSWTEDWLRQRGLPDPNGQVVSAAWWES